MVYVFVFLGEFGFELLNWQGVVRKFSKTLSPSDKIVCCSRANLYPFYEMADVYIDISEIEHLKQSRATWYWASQTDTVSLNFMRGLAFDRRLRTEIKSFVLNRLKTMKKFDANASMRFVFSSGKTQLNGCKFGVTRIAFVIDSLASVYDALGSTPLVSADALDALKRVTLKSMNFLDMRRLDDDAYGMLDVHNNTYRKIEPDPSVSSALEERLGFCLEEPFVLCQGRRRDTTQLSKDLLPEKEMGELIELLARKAKVVLLSFHTGRWLDSYSEFEVYPNCFRYACRSFPEQACLIDAASRCLFFTEGDLGSHIYVPPFLGKDVVAIAPATVYQIGTTPIALWNREIFRFGGQIIHKTSEEVFSSRENIASIVQELFPTSLGDSTR